MIDHNTIATEYQKHKGQFDSVSDAIYYTSRVLNKSALDVLDSLIKQNIVKWNKPTRSSQPEYLSDVDTLSEEEESSSFGNATAAGKVWNSGATRGSGNPTDNHGVTSMNKGMVRGVGNPVNTQGD
jgi:hypothetical protein